MKKINKLRITFCQQMFRKEWESILMTTTTLHCVCGRVCVYSILFLHQKHAYTYIPLVSFFCKEILHCKVSFQGQFVNCEVYIINHFL